MISSPTEPKEFACWVRRIAHWMESTEVPRIPFAGFSRVGCKQPPSRCIEFVYRGQGALDNLYIGDRLVTAQERHISIRNVHFGNHSSRLRHDLEAWSLFLDCSETQAFPELENAPFYLAIPASDPHVLIHQFEKIAALCILPGQTQVTGYHPRTFAYTPTEKHAGNTCSRRLRLKASILDLFAHMLEQAEAQSGNHPLHPPAIRAAIAHMGTAYAKNDLTVAGIAEKADMNVDYFGRLFHRAVGMTPGKYLRELRIDQARLLLQQTELRINEIAANVGFADPLHFSRLFKKETGLSPRRYRTQAN